jgi:hypothetical protein
MSLRGESKRKILSARDPRSQYQLASIESMQKVLTDGHSTAHFERLLYKNCPVLPVHGRKHWTLRNLSMPIDMNRQSLVYRITSTLNSMDRTVRTKINTFSVLVDVFRFCDSNEISDIFSVNAISKYIETLVTKYHSGVKGKHLLQKQSTLRSFIKEFNPELHSELEPNFFDFPQDSQSATPYSDGELKQLYECLDSIYQNYAECVEKNLEPSSFPLTSTVKTKVRAVRANNNVDQWKFDLSRAAYFLTCFYTGINAGPLLSLKHEDISIESFKQVSRGTYKLATVKGRQGGRVNYLDVGFSRTAKEFFKRWLFISKHLLAANNEYVYPKVLKGVTSKMTVSEASGINATFVKLGYPSLRSQRFRQTKSSIIMRSTRSVFAVSEGLNNSIATVDTHYSDGDPTLIEFSLAAALDIRERTARGQQLQHAWEESSYKFKDPIREKHLKDLQLTATSISNGLRCSMPFGEKAGQLKQMLIQNGLAARTETVACYKFLDCFSCEFHAVIAEVQDVWLLLSFNDVILQSLTRPSVNSNPTIVLSKVSSTVNTLLEKIAVKHPDIYQAAHEKYLDSPHPLWTDAADLDLLLGVYK